MQTKELVLYKTQDNDISIDVLLENETVWLSQKQTEFASSKAKIQLFGISEQLLTNIFARFLKKMKKWYVQNLHIPLKNKNSQKKCRVGNSDMTLKNRKILCKQKN